MGEFFKKTMFVKSGVTLMEIMMALLIMAFAFLPIIGVIGTSTKDTDVANSYVFAQTTARNILDTLLDDVPFNSIKAPSGGGVATLENYGGYDVNSFLSMVGSSDSKSSGSVMDERGTEYAVEIFVYPIIENKSGSTEGVSFVYRKRPEFDKEADWYTFDSNGAFIKKNYAKSPYELEANEEVVTAYDMGARPIENSEEYCVMKKVLLRLLWTGRDRHQRSLELYTMKANLDSEVNK